MQPDQLPTKERFVLETEEHRDPDQGKNTWSHTLCKVMEVLPDGSRKQLGVFTRSYHCLCDTWEPFEQDGKFFALCSRDYTATAVMALPECEVIAEETPHSFGFCPTGFYVPTEMKIYIDDDEPEPLPEEWRGQFGFVCGCIWGDDTNWKVEFLDLSEITKGKIIRDNRLGYLELPGGGDSLSRFVFVDSDTNEFPDRLIIRALTVKSWVGGLKWTAKAKKDEEEKLDLNAMADELTKYVMRNIKYALSKKEIPEELLTDEFKQDIRDVAISYLGSIVIEEDGE
jgi:hypothetical protein